YACGRLNIGRWIRYVPYPVIGGFLASTGWTLVLGGIRVITSKPVTLAALPQMVHPEILFQVCVGVIFTVAMLLILSRTKHFLALPGLLVAGTAIVHVVRAVFGMSVARAQEVGWLLKVAGGGRVWVPLRDAEWSMFHNGF